VFALTTAKNEITHGMLYREIKAIAEELGYDLQPITAMSDFELANMNANRDAFPGVIIKGCLFHFGQSIWRNVEDKGLRSSYVDDREVRQQIQHVLGLPFVPLDDVIDVFNDIMEDDLSDAVLEVYEYFKKHT